MKRHALNLSFMVRHGERSSQITYNSLVLIQTICHSKETSECEVHGQGRKLVWNGGVTQLCSDMRYGTV